MRHKIAGPAGRGETESWKAKDSCTTSDYAGMQEEAEDAAIRETWSKTPDATPMPRHGQGNEAKFLLFLTHHKLVPHDSTVETLRALLDDHDSEKRKQLIKELETLPSSDKDKENYQDLHSYLVVAPSETESTDVLGNSVEEPAPEMKAASRSDLKRMKRIVEQKQGDGMHTELETELKAHGLYAA